MTASEDISIIFSIFHDGEITGWSGNNTLLTLCVECQYLAERIDKSFDRFYVELAQVDELHLSTWPDPHDLPVRTLTTPADIFKAELEILSAEIKDGKAVITCLQHNKEHDYSGGHLTIHCGAIRVFDQHRNQLTIDRIGKTAKDYWAEWRKK